jgi:hypothetical protein
MAVVHLCIIALKKVNLFHSGMELQSYVIKIAVTVSKLTAPCHKTYGRRGDEGPCVLNFDTVEVSAECHAQSILNPSNGPTAGYEVR